MNAGKIFFGFLLLTIAVAVLADGTGFGTLEKQTGPAQREVRSAEYKVMPAATTARGLSDEVRIPRGDGGHYWAEARVDGSPVTFVIDTGASHISLSYEDADAIGLDPDSLEYDGQVSTANGTARIAQVTLSTVRIGNIEMYDIPAIVSSRGALPVSLLGMSFLNRLSNFEIDGRDLVLRY